MRKYFDRGYLIPFLQKNMMIVSIVAVVVILVGGFGIYRLFAAENCVVSDEETVVSFDPEGIYALLLPRKDGNALNLNLKRTGAYETISYELAYKAATDEVANEESSLKSRESSEDGVGASGDQGIDRGVVGDIKVDKKAPEYNQEILFGTCSKNVCKYDKDVANGTLTIHLTGSCGKQVLSTPWHVQNLDIALGKVTSGDNHFIYQVASDSGQTSAQYRETLVKTGYTIVNEITSVPKLPKGKTVFEKVYALNVPEAKTLTKGDVVIETAANPPTNATIGVYIDEKNDWQLLETKIEGSKLSAQAPQSGIFAILIDQK